MPLRIHGWGKVAKVRRNESFANKKKGFVNLPTEPTVNPGREKKNKGNTNITHTIIVIGLLISP
jgi:hypothetical protein